MKSVRNPKYATIGVMPKETADVNANYRRNSNSEDPLYSVPFKSYQKQQQVGIYN